MRPSPPEAVLLVALGLLLPACTPDVPPAPVPPSAYGEPHRPQFHFSPPSMWMNDPNGMVYLDGEYHLFYQHYPDSTVWGPMHWGHAVSTDLVHWQHLPIALYPDSLGYIFSGSAVVDAQNTAGFQTGDALPLVAIFTQHDPEGEREGRDDYQTQGLAFSNDKGRTWTMYEGNPVLPNPGIRDFRDPKVFRHEATDRWIMVLAVADRVHLYASSDLKTWSFLSEFGAGAGSHGGVWECPDLFPLTVEGTDETRWVLLVSINPGAPNGGSGTQYFVGDFDGRTFTSANPPDQSLWLDHGRDNYAGVSWSGVPDADGRRLFIGWMSNWDYAQQVPTHPWRSAMTLPRALSLVETAAGLRVASAPVAELQALRGAPIEYDAPSVDSLAAIEALGGVSTYEAVLDFDRAASGNVFGIELANANGDVYRFGYDRAAGRLFSDRTRAGLRDFSDAFAANPHPAPYEASGERIRFHVFVDVASIEAFVDDGRAVMTELFFPQAPFDRTRLFSEGGPTTLIRATFYPLNGIWD